MEITASERALLGLFMAKIHKIDPDVLVVCLFANFFCLTDDFLSHSPSDFIFEIFFLNLLKRHDSNS